MDLGHLRQRHPKAEASKYYPTRRTQYSFPFLVYMLDILTYMAKANAITRLALAASTFYLHHREISLAKSLYSNVRQEFAHPKLDGAQSGSSAT
jgi:hypothetical protein